MNSVNATTTIVFTERDAEAVADNFINRITQLVSLIILLRYSTFLLTCDYKEFRPERNSSVTFETEDPALKRDHENLGERHLKWFTVEMAAENGRATAKEIVEKAEEQGIELWELLAVLDFQALPQKLLRRGDEIPGDLLQPEDSEYSKPDKYAIRFIRSARLAVLDRMRRGG